MRTLSCNIKKVAYLSLLSIFTLFFSYSIHASDKLLKGLWMETANFPASSIIRFERKGKQIIGKYTQVSLPQKNWGFEVGETIIRGTMKDKVFIGEVLLKFHKELKEQCPELSIGWTPIELYSMQPDKIYGRWLQANFYKDEDGKCLVSRYDWQLYGLEKINLK